MSKDKDFVEWLKDWNITAGTDKCEEAIKVIEKTLLESVKKDMIKKIEAIKDTNEMREFTLYCAKATLYDFERSLKVDKWKKKK